MATKKRPANYQYHLSEDPARVRRRVKQVRAPFGVTQIGLPGKYTFIAANNKDGPSFRTWWRDVLHALGDDHPLPNVEQAHQCYQLGQSATLYADSIRVRAPKRDPKNMHAFEIVAEKKQLGIDIECGVGSAVRARIDAQMGELDAELVRRRNLDSDALLREEAARRELDRQHVERTKVTFGPPAELSDSEIDKVNEVLTCEHGTVGCTNKGPRHTCHNHLTRDIKPPGVCPGCDLHHARTSVDALVRRLTSAINTWWKTNGIRSIGAPEGREALALYLAPLFAPTSSSPNLSSSNFSTDPSDRAPVLTRAQSRAVTAKLELVTSLFGDILKIISE